eukprot:3467226-Rhodomonas_salina.1
MDIFEPGSCPSRPPPSDAGALRSTSGSHRGVRRLYSATKKRQRIAPYAATVPEGGTPSTYDH